MNDFKLNLSNHVSLAARSASPAFNKAQTSSQSNKTNFSNGLIPIDKNKSKKSQLKIPSIRFDLKLNKPSSEKFTEYNYNKLALKTFKLAKRLKKKQSSEQTVVKSADLPIIDKELKIESKKIKDLLNKFRQKIILSKELDDDEGLESNDNLEDDYSNFDQEEDSNQSVIKPKKKSKKSDYDFDLNKFKLQDFSYLGKGYDESDSFIDNSDAQDARLPKNMVPKHGGFYINSKKLKLKTIDEYKKTSKKSKNEQSLTDQNVDQNESEDEDYTDSDDFDSEEESSDESGSESSDETSTQSDEDDEDEETEQETKNNKNIPEIDLASSNSSCKITSNQAQKKSSKKRVIDDEDDEQKSGESENLNEDENKNKENNSDQLLINNKKRKNDTQSIDVNLNQSIEKAQSNLKIEEMNGFKKKKIDSAQTQILNEKNQIEKSLVQVIIKKDESNEYIDVEEEVNSDQNRTSLIANTSFKSNQNISQSINTQTSTLPDNISNDFKQLINKLIELHSQKMNSSSEPLLPELKAILLKIYSESKRLKLQSQIFNYVSFKLNRNKEALFRCCRRMLNKETINSSPQVNQSPGLNLSIKNDHQSTTTPTSSQTQQSKIQNKPTTIPVQAVQAVVQPTTPRTPQTTNQMQTLNLKQQSPLHQNSPQVSFPDLSEDLRNKLLYLKNEYVLSKQKMEVSKFFDSPQINNMIYLIDCSIRNNNRNLPRSKEFCINYLSEAFELNKDIFIKKYNSIVSQIKLKNIENVLKKKMNELKNEIDLEMPKNLEKYSKSLDDYNKNKLLLEKSNTPESIELKKKLNPPRKKFELTEKTRELIVSIIQLKISLFNQKSSHLNSPSPSQNANDSNLKLSYIDNFFETELLNLWPKNWMQKNVLLNIYQIRYCQQQRANNQQQHQQQQQSNTSNLNTINQNLSKTISAPTTPATPQTSLNKLNQPIINISSKNGKQVKIEPQSSSSTNSTNQTFSTPLNNTALNKQVLSQNVNRNQTAVLPTTPTTPTTAQLLSQQQQQEQFLAQTKHNVYDSVINQFKNKPVTQQQKLANTSLNSSMNLEELFQNNTTNLPQNFNQMANLITNITSQSDLHKMQLQQFNFMNLLNPPSINSHKQNNSNNQ